MTHGRGSPLAVLLPMVLAVVLAGCGTSTAGPSAGAAAETTATLPDLPGSATLAAAATARAEEVCDTGGEAAPADAASTADRYDQETWAAVAELVGTAVLGDDGGAAARHEAHRAWAGSPALAETWDRRADASVECADGRLSVVTVLARSARASAAGRYGAVRFRSTEVVHRAAVRYGRATDVAGRPVDLLLDLYLPDETAPGRPALVMVHGGGFEGGSRSMHTADARAYARRGFVVATVDYRLDPDAGRSVATHRAAARAALDDAREAVRWLRAHADDLGIDPGRIAAVGASAGGEVALGLALLAEPGAAVAAAVSTGAYLTPLLGQADLDRDAAPVFLQFSERDTASGRRWSYAAGTCDAVRSAGGTCDLAVRPGEGHTIGLGPTGPEADRILAFLAVHLRLGDA